MTVDRIVLVTKKTALDELLECHYSRDQADFYLKSRGSSIDTYTRDHAGYQNGLEVVRSSLPRDVPHVVIERATLYSFMFRGADLVIALGSDGLFVNLAKFLDGQPVMGVNPHDRVGTAVMRHFPSQVSYAIGTVIDGSAKFDHITLASLKTNDSREMLAVNDFLIGRRDQISARYKVTVGRRTDRQSSSGILVSTGMGKTGWLSSVLTMVRAIGGEITHNGVEALKWDSPGLVYAVREPFVSSQTQARLVFGTISPGAPLIVESEMPEGGYIMSDGMIDDGLEFNSGTTVTVKAASKQAVLVRP